MDRWVNRTAVVTGASSGIGAEICVQLANAGLRVVGLARRVQLVDDLKNRVNGKGSITSRKCDVSNVEEIKDTFKWVEESFGGVDVMVNNAGVYFNGYITELAQPLGDEQILTTLDTNLKALILCSRLAIASMKRRDFDGHIINVNSIAGHYVPYSPLFNVYSATKHAQTAFNTALLSELATFRSRIKVTSLSPGMTSTEMTDAVLAVRAMPALKASDVADAALYVLGTAPHVNISELTIQPVSEIRL